MDYKKAKIYKIVCDTTGLVYIGATCQPALSTRLGQHVTNYKKFVKTGVNKNGTSISVIENGNYKIFLIEKVPCDTKDELSRRERFHIEANVCVNKYIPTRTMVEYRHDNADKIKDYYNGNRDYILEQKKEYYNGNRDHIREQQKEYKQRNADRLREYNKIYYQNKKLQKMIKTDP